MRPRAHSSAINEALVQRGVSPSTTESVMRKFPMERIETQLEVFDWLVEQKDARVSRNPAGFLIASIKGEYAAPHGFLTREERERREQQSARRKARVEERKQQRAAEQSARAEKLEHTIHEFWRNLSADERLRLEHEALAGATSLQRDLLTGEGSLAIATRKSILDAFALRMMQLEG